VLELKTRRALMADLQELRDRAQATQRLIAEWKAAAERVKTPRKRKAPKENMEFPF
jgi:hypothetical protein